MGFFPLTTRVFYCFRYVNLHLRTQARFRCPLSLIQLPEVNSSDANKVLPPKVKDDFKFQFRTITSIQTTIKEKRPEIEVFSSPSLMPWALQKNLEIESNAFLNVLNLSPHDIMWYVHENPAPIWLYVLRSCNRSFWNNYHQRILFFNTVYFWLFQSQTDKEFHRVAEQ